MYLLEEQLSGKSSINEILGTEKFEFKNEMNGSKATTYKNINDSLSVHDVCNIRTYIPDFKRVSFSKFRLSSHHLKIETG